MQKARRAALGLMASAALSAALPALAQENTRHAPSRSSCRFRLAAQPTPWHVFWLPS